MPCGAANQLSADCGTIGAAVTAPAAAGRRPPPPPAGAAPSSAWAAWAHRRRVPLAAFTQLGRSTARDSTTMLADTYGLPKLMPPIRAGQAPRANGWLCK
jgi:hypothetical protein